MANKRFVSYDDMHKMLNKMYRDMVLTGYKPDLVVGLARGGLVPAVHMSHYFDVPMASFKFSLRDHPGKDDIMKLIELMDGEKQILIVDDICDEGHTLHEIFETVCATLSPEDPSAAMPVCEALIKTAVLQHNTGADLFVPDYFGEQINKLTKPEWIVYPYEY